MKRNYHQRPKKGRQPTRVRDSSAVTVSPNQLSEIPETYQELINFFQSQDQELTGPILNALRIETIKRIEQITGRPLICYVSRTNVQDPNVPTQIDHSDLTGFSDLVHGIDGKDVDVLIVSNGGLPEAAERIVDLLRRKFEHIRFIVPSNAYSAATLICLSGNSILMDIVGTLGPIDPQIGGFPARSILRAFETIEGRLKEEGPAALTAYLPLISKYDLHILEICKSAQELSNELAGTFLSRYMLQCSEDDPRVATIVSSLADFDKNKSHARSINRENARELGIVVEDVESFAGLQPLVNSLNNQHVIFFDKTGFFKLYENSIGISWGRQVHQVNILVPDGRKQGPIPSPQPGPPQPSN